ncbi:MAG: NUDIX hydrolase [Lachnospiraceae bacterium]|nr:NUDIX hydrolase [Lachnospiraceae bacterium]
MKPQRRISRELAYNGKIIDIYCDTIELENGNIAKFDYIGHKGAAAVVPVKDDGKILLVRQYRNALDRFTLEIPAGGKNGIEEEGIKCAARELEEETGYRSDNLVPLIAVNTTVAFCNELIEIFLARDLKESKQNLDEDEFVEVEEYSLDELIKMIKEGTITDSKTVSAILAYKEFYA